MVQYNFNPKTERHTWKYGGPSGGITSPSAYRQYKDFEGKEIDLTLYFQDRKDVPGFADGTAFTFDAAVSFYFSDGRVISYALQPLHIGTKGMLSTKTGDYEVKKMIPKKKFP